jgi:hypothetical protein
MPVHQRQLPENDIVKELVLKDLNRGEYYLLAKGMSVEWDADDRLYLFRVPQGFWEGSSVPRASLGVPLIYEHIESLMPQVMSALFADSPPFEANARPKVKQNAARAAKEIITYQLDEMKFREELRKCCKEMLVYGTCYMRLGWRKYKKTVFERVRRGKPKVTLTNGLPVKSYEQGDGKWMVRPKTITVNEPYCENVHVRREPDGRLTGSAFVVPMCHEHAVMLTQSLGSNTFEALYRIHWADEHGGQK